MLQKGGAPALGCVPEMIQNESWRKGRKQTGAGKSRSGASFSEVCQHLQGY